MKLFKSITSPFTNWYEANRKRQFRLTADYGIGTEVTEFKSTLKNATGKTMKTFAMDDADKACLEELVDGKWSHIFTYPFAV